MELDFKSVKSAPVWAEFGAHCKRGLVQNKIIERVVYRITLFMHWFSYCSRHHYNSYSFSLELLIQNHVFCVVFLLLTDRKMPLPEETFNKASLLTKGIPWNKKLLQNLAKQEKWWINNWPDPFWSVFKINENNSFTHVWLPGY